MKESTVRWLQELAGDDKEKLHRFYREVERVERREKEGDTKDTREFERDFSTKKYEEARDKAGLRPIGNAYDDEDGNWTEEDIEVMESMVNGSDKKAQGEIDRIKEGLGISPQFNEGIKRSGLIFESVKSINWVETDNGKPFRFSGIAFVADQESANKRFYPLNISKRAVDRANQNIDSMTIEMGHPKDGNETSPERIIGNMVEWELKDNNEVAFVGELNNTSLGKDAQELVKSRPVGAQALSIRAGGDMANETAPDGHKRKRITDMELYGLDLVKAGGFSKAKVGRIGESQGHNREVEIISGIYVPAELIEEGGQKVWDWLVSNKNSLLAGIEKEDIVKIING